MKSQLPIIKFNVDRNNEKRVVSYFLSRRKKNTTGFDEFGKLIRDFPELNKTKNLSVKETKKIIFEFIEDYYKKHEAELEKKKEEIEKNWEKVSESFFKET